MSSLKKEMKKLENQQKAQEQLKQLESSIKEIDRMISKFYKDGQDYLLNNNEVGFELIANNILYFTDVRNMIDTVRIQFDTYVQTAKFIDTVEGIRPVLKNTAKMMASMPNFNKNNKDFAKFRKGLMRGQLNMKAMTSMCSTINPAIQTTRTKEEMDALKERMLMGAPGNLNVQTNTATATETTKVSENQDFFDAINS